MAGGWVSSCSIRVLMAGERTHNGLKILFNSYLEILDECNMEFLIRSQTSLNKWYTMNLSREWFECNNWGPICIHMLAVEIIVDDKFQYL